MGRQTLASTWQAAVKRAGIEDLRFHDLRHEAISRLAERGDFNVLELSAISGHKTLSMLNALHAPASRKIGDEAAWRRRECVINSRHHLEMANNSCMAPLNPLPFSH